MKKETTLKDVELCLEEISNQLVDLDNIYEVEYQIRTLKESLNMSNILTTILNIVMVVLTIVILYFTYVMSK